MKTQTVPNLQIVRRHRPVRPASKRSFFRHHVGVAQSVVGISLLSLFSLSHHSPYGEIFIDGLFICDSCDAGGLALRLSDTHDRTHALVRCQPTSEELSTEQRLVTMEGRLSKMESLLHVLLGRLKLDNVAVESA